MVGPLLFIMFINEIARNSCLTKFVIYADDTSAMVLSDLRYWLTVNSLTLNETRTKLSVF